MTHRRQFTSHCVWLALVGALIPRRAWLQSGDVVKVLVGFPPGGSGDTVARRLIERLRAELGSTFIVGNRPGAGPRSP